MVTRLRFGFCLTCLFTLWTCGQGDLQKGRLCLRQGDADRAVVFLEKAVLDAPDDLEARRLLAEALRQQLSNMDNRHDDLPGHWRRVVQEYRVVFSQAGDSLGGVQLQSSWRAWCEALEFRGDSTLALSQYQELLRWFPQNLDADNAAALLAFRMNHWDEAQAFWKQAMALDTTSIVAPFNYGMAFWLRGNPQEALRQWLVAFERNPLDTNVVGWLVEARKSLGQP
ncbi:MAG TPA: tetratricopeptide repeat protein [Fibrobacteraceae bacterium]|nr:tetratricopeptide repeat protein [Fibrobacteraceae bacterium]